MIAARVRWLGLLIVLASSTIVPLAQSTQALSYRGHAASEPCMAITQKWLSLGGANGFVGQPVDDEKVAPDGWGHFRYFQHAAIYWSPLTCAHVVYGEIFSKWARLQWERGPLGYPITDELPAAYGGRYSRFQYGAIYWTPRTGAHAIVGAIYQSWVNQGAETTAGLGYPLTDELRLDPFTNATTIRVSYFTHGEI